MKPRCWKCGKFVSITSKFARYPIYGCKKHDRNMFKRALYMKAYTPSRAWFIRPIEPGETRMIIFGFSAQSTGKSLQP